MTNDLDIPASRDADPKDHPGQQGALRRKTYWEQFGTTTTVAFHGGADGAARPWPSEVERFLPVWLPDSLVLTTDGLSDPWGERPGDVGAGLEYYIDSPRLRGASIGELQSSWELRLLMRVVANFAEEEYRAPFDDDGCFPLRVSGVDVPTDWLDAEGHLCLVLGVPSGVRSEHLDVDGDPVAVRFVAMTPMRPDEFEWALRSGEFGVVARALTSSVYGNRVRLDRPSIAEDLAAPGSEAGAGEGAGASPPGPGEGAPSEGGVEEPIETGLAPAVEAVAMPPGAAKAAAEASRRPAVEFDALGEVAPPTPQATPSDAPRALAGPGRGPDAPLVDAPAVSGSPATAETEASADVGRGSESASEAGVGSGPEAVPVPAEESVPVPAEEPVPVPAEESAPVPADEPVPVLADEPVPVPAEESVPVPAFVPVPLEELPWDETWVESRIQEHLLSEPELVPVGAPAPVPEEYLERFAGVLPESVLHVWRRCGFEGFGRGRTWITDPVAWAPVVEAWLDGVELPFPDQTWWCLTRTALGGMALWGELSGPSLEIDPLSGVVRLCGSLVDRMASPIMRERMGTLLLVDPMEDFYEDADSDRDLIDVAIERLGPVDADQVYGYVPAGGQVDRLSASALSIQDAVSHLTSLAQAVERRLETDVRHHVVEEEVARPDAGESWHAVEVAASVGGEYIAQEASRADVDEGWHAVEIPAAEGDEQAAVEVISPES